MKKWVYFFPICALSLCMTACSSAASVTDIPESEATADVENETGESVSGNDKAADKPDVDDTTVIATIDGEEITLSEITGQLASMESMYSSLGGQISEEELKEKLFAGAMEILNRYIDEQLVKAKIEEYGLSLTEEEKQQAIDAWDEKKKSIEKSIGDSYGAMTEDESATIVEYFMQQSGITKEGVIENAENIMLAAKLKDLVLADLPEIDNQTIEEEYNALLAEQEESFEDIGKFETAIMTGDIIAYVPREYRVIKELNISVDEETIPILRDLKKYDTEEDDSYENILEQEMTKLKISTMSNAKKMLESGMSYDEVAEKFDGKVSTNYICEDTTRVSEQFYDIAMGIENPGGIGSDYLEREYGASILIWDGILDEGITDEDTVKSEIKEELIRKQKVAEWNKLQQQWRDEAEIVINEEALKY